MKKKLVIAIFLFCLLFFMGMVQAKNKKMWNDEIFSTISSIENRNYVQILIPAQGGSEGNISPLFYILQKAWIDAVGYQIPQQWTEAHRDWSLEDTRSNIMLRVPAVFYMVLSIILIFLYFSHYHSLRLAFYSLLVSISSFMVWMYMAEARPYSLWVLLSTLQSLIVLVALKEKTCTRNLWLGILGVNILLSLTVIFSIVQIAIAALLWWLVIEKRMRHIVIGFIIPLLIALFFYIKSPKFDFWFEENGLQLINASYPKDRMFLAGVFILFYLVNTCRLKNFKELFKSEISVYLLNAVLLLISSIAIVGVFYLKQTTKFEGFQISNRYFIYLVPVCIILTTHASQYLVQIANRRALKVLSVSFLGILLLFRLVKTYQLTGFGIF